MGWAGAGKLKKLSIEELKSCLLPAENTQADLSMLAIGGYNALLYLALNTSTPINVTLVGSITPVWMLLIGRVAFGMPISGRQWLGALLSISGVMLVLSRGQLEVLLQVRPVAGDLYILLASAAWAYYSWMLAHPTTEPPEIRRNWSAFLLAQITFGLLWSALFAGGEWALGLGRLQLGWPLVTALLFIASGPAVLSSAFLGEVPHLYHALAFVLIVGGIAVSARR